MNQTKRMCRIALTGTFLFCTFISLSNILYVEAITLMIICCALVFQRKDAVLSALIFGGLLIIYMGLTPWSVLYLIIYPTYSLVTSLLKKILKSSAILLIVYGFILSAATGMILDLPYILVSKSVTLFYILTGLKTSIIQGAITAFEMALISEPLCNVLEKVKEG